MAIQKEQKTPTESSYLIVLVPWEVLSRQDEPVLFGATLHDANVVDGEPALADHLCYKNVSLLRMPGADSVDKKRMALHTQT